MSLATCTSWLHRLGFSVQDYKKGTYFDGHERHDVVTSKNLYIAQKKLYDLRIHHNDPTAAEKAASLLLPMLERILIEIVHDEAAFNCNEDDSKAWVEDGKTQKLKSKSKGQGVMASVYLSELECWGCGFDKSSRVLSLLVLQQVEVSDPGAAVLYLQVSP